LNCLITRGPSTQVTRRRCRIALSVTKSI
jgi:hypothetical protein